MCFSATASFTAAAVLTGIGATTLYKNRSEKTLLFAAMPILFGIQQALEGIVWLTLNAGDTSSLLHQIGVAGFLFIASLLWPVWMPTALYLLETQINRKKLLVICLFIGAFTSALFSIYWYNKGIRAEIFNNHIYYSSLPQSYFTLFPPYFILMISYFASTLLPCFISSIKYVWVFGVLITIGSIVAELSSALNFESLWCFFAAAASIAIYFILEEYRKRKTVLYD